MFAFLKPIFYTPLFNLFVGLYNIIPGHDIGLVILVITLLVRLVLYPLTSSSIKAQKSMQELQPKLDEIRKKYATDKQAQAQAIMEVYKNHKVNPFASCLPMLIQLPILIALYLALRDGLASTNLAENLYSFVHNPGVLSPISLGLLDLSKPNIVLAVLAGAAQFWQARMMMAKNLPKGPGEGAKDENMMSMMNKQMMYMMPIMTVAFGFKLAAGLMLYWFLSTLFTALQQLFLFRKSKNNQDPGPAKPNVIEGKIVS